MTPTAGSSAPSDLLAAGTSCHDFDLLKIRGWPETKVVMERQCKTIFGHKICTDIPVLYARSCELHVTASICHPELPQILGDVQECLKQAAITGVIVGLITTQQPIDLAPTDCELPDWRQAGLRQPSFFRLFTVTLLQREVRLIGRLSESDWTSVRTCFKAGFGSD